MNFGLYLDPMVEKFNDFAKKYGINVSNQILLINPVKNTEQTFTIKNTIMLQNGTKKSLMQETTKQLSEKERSELLAIEALLSLRNDIK